MKEGEVQIFTDGDNEDVRLRVPYEEDVHVKTVKEFDEDDRPRERAERYGIESLSTPDLLALILRTGTPGRPITEICRDLMRASDHKLKTLERRKVKDLMTVKGLGRVKAQQIEAIMEIVRRYGREGAGERVVVKDARTIFEVMGPEIGNEDHEEIWILLLNRANVIIGKKRMTQGSATASIFDMKAIIREALLVGADAIVLCHNHPSGQLRPSPQDDTITFKLHDACKLMEMRMLDHVIVTAHSFYSYQQEGRL